MALFQFLKKNSLIILVFIFGLILLSYRLGTNPVGVFVDEAVVGYDAYSILNTSKDHFGKTIPIYFKFFGSYTPGLFVYLQTIPVKILGLNSFSIRILSVISMLAVALGIYIFLKKTKLGETKILPILGTFLFIITPWTFFNARVGYETTFAFALMSLGVLLYRNPLLSFILISLSTYAGHSQRYLAPLIIGLIYFIFYFKKTPIKKILKPIIIALIIQIPNLILLFTPSFWVKNGSLTGNFLNQYLSYFLPINLFNGKDYDLQRSMPELSVFYFWMFIPWIVGFYSIYKNWNKPVYRYLLGLVLLAPIPAALANTNYSTQRALLLLLPYSLVITLGLDEIIKRFKARFWLPILSLLILYSLVLLWRSYFVLMPAERAENWNYGYKSLSGYILNNPEKKFVVDNSRSVPYIELLFFMKYSPSKFQQENLRIGQNYYKDIKYSGDVKFANVEVRPIDWPRDIYKDVVLVGDGLSISSDQTKEHFLENVFEVKNVWGKILLQAYKTNPELKLKMSKK